MKPPRKDLESELAFLRRFADRVHKALKPAIKPWQKEMGNPLTWPDTVRHVEWLVARQEQLDKALELACKRLMNCGEISREEIGCKGTDCNDACCESNIKSHFIKQAQAKGRKE